MFKRTLWMILLFAAALSWGCGSADEQEADTKETTREKAQPEPEKKPAAKPEPTVDELVRSKVNRAFGVPKQNKAKVVTEEGNGCLAVAVSFYENTKDAIEANMHNVTKTFTETSV